MENGKTVLVNDESTIMQVLQESRLAAGRKHIIPTTKNDLCKDICELIAKTDWSVENIKKLYEAVIAKTVSKSCAMCRRLTSVFEGEQVYPGGDLSKPKQFVCKGCASRM